MLLYHMNVKAASCCSRKTLSIQYIILHSEAKPSEHPSEVTISKTLVGVEGNYIKKRVVPV